MKFFDTTVKKEVSVSTWPPSDHEKMTMILSILHWWIMKLHVPRIQNTYFPFFPILKDKSLVFYDRGSHQHLCFVNQNSTLSICMTHITLFFSCLPHPPWNLLTDDKFFLLMESAYSRLDVILLLSQPWRQKKMPEVCSSTDCRGNKPQLYLSELCITFYWAYLA